MRYAVLVLALAGAFVAEAFDSAAWLAKRALFDAEVTRLQVAYTNCAAQAAQAATDVNIPIDMFRDGSVRTTIHADEAFYFVTTGMIWARGVTLTRLADDRSVDTSLKADACVIDRQTRSGWAEGNVSLTHARTELKGRGVYFSSIDGYVSVRAAAEATSYDLRFGGYAP